MPYYVEPVAVVALLALLVTAVGRRYTRPRGAMARNSAGIAVVAVMAITTIVLYEVFLHNRVHHILSTVGAPTEEAYPAGRDPAREAR
jgi:hypothetical protein